MRRPKDDNQYRQDIIDALFDGDKRSDAYRYSTDFIVNVLFEYDKSRNMAAVARKFDVNVKSVAKWVEKKELYIKKKYEENALAILNMDKEVTAEDLSRQELELESRRKDNMVKMGKTLEAVESKFYEMSASAIYDMVNHLLVNMESMSDGQKIQFLNTMLKVKGDSVASAKEINRKMYQFLISQIVGFLVKMFEQGKLECKNGLTRDGLFIELDNIKNMALMDADGNYK